MKSRNRIIVEDYLLVFVAYILLATSIIAINMFKVETFKMLATGILIIGAITIIYCLHSLNNDKELLS